MGTHGRVIILKTEEVWSMLKFVGGNGKIAEVQAGTKAVDVLEALGLKKGAVAAAVDGRGVDLSRPLEEGAGWSRYSPGPTRGSTSCATPRLT